uniref:NADH-ubiquinone oxidoreductase chain 2 n=1 Tax=Achilidae gen. 1 sp. n. 1 SX-2018 TaxID=2232070 RepID=A0A3S5XHN7_9HEMI|nr:NADH dehydrogenase subunit 2 [Achilidae gen. 1 sp. n. 1 SX-2018]
MKMNMTNMMFLTIMMTSTIMVISSNNMLFSWTSMEINFISFLPILNKSKKISDQTMKYLIIQSLSSSLMLMAMMMNSTMNNKTECSMLLMASMMMKTGMMPLHLWMPSLMQMMSWENCMIFSTWQKVAPTILLSQMIQMKFMIPIFHLNLLISPITGVKQTSTKKMMAYSSISNSPWMIMATKMSKLQSIYFFSIYSMLMMTMTKSMKKNNMNFMNQLKHLNSSQKFLLMSTMLSISGMPPLMGFFPKWMIMQSMTLMSTQMTISLLLSSIISTFMYMKMIYPTMMEMYLNKKTKLMSKQNLIKVSLNLMGIPMTMILKMN